MIGDYFVVKANTRDEAVEISKGCPDLMYGTNAEVRDVMNIDNDAASAKFLYSKNGKMIELSSAYADLLNITRIVI